MRKSSEDLPRVVWRSLDVQVVPAEAAHARAYALLKDAVFAGEFRPGEILTLRSLSKQLAVGEMPAREALRRLTAEGAFEALPNRSARVPKLTRRQVEQILELRGSLEGKAAALAARNITLVQIEHLQSLQEDLAKSIDKGDSRSHTTLHRRFHFEIHRIADNSALQALIQTLWLRMAPIAANSLALPAAGTAAFRRLNIANHQRLIAAFQSRDPAAAKDAIRRNLIESTQLAGYWERLELTPP